MALTAYSVPTGGTAYSVPTGGTAYSVPTGGTASSGPLRPFSDCYHYHSLFADDLRLLWLEPPGENDEIQCRMSYTRLSEKPTYEALSYAWGSLENLRFIRVDGTGMLVGKNLWHALRALRPPLGHSARCLWVDALCINQGNRVETFQEVQKMVPIYEGASRVICWLGSYASEEAKSALKLFRAVKESFGDRNLSDSKKTEEFARFLVTNELLNAGLDTLRLFSERPYWIRMWIRQELIFAAKIMIQCGQYTMSWDDAAQTCAALDFLSQQTGFAACSTQQTIYFKHFRWIHTSRSLFRSIKGPEWFLKQLEACRSAAATDPKDKVYGLCALFKSALDEDGRRLTPNYGFSLVDVYLQAFQYCVFDCRGEPRSDHCLDILCSSRLQSNESCEIPSWLPDWSQDTTSAPIPRELRPGISASLGRKPEVIMHWERKLLRCKGLRVGIVKHVGRCFRAVGPLIQDFHKLRLEVFRSWCDITAQILEPGEDWHRLISILWLGNGFGDISEEYHDVNRVVKDIFDYEHGHDPEDLTTLPDIFYRISSLSWLNHRRLAVSDGFKLVLAPEEVRKGDRICVIYGCSVPILLRRHDTETYQVVGDCYVEGFMDGEAIQARNKRRLRSKQFTLR